MASMTVEQIVDAIRDAGLVGAGGAGFPTHVKAGAKVETLIANGAECEPMLDCDAALMTHHPKAVVEGMKLMARSTGATRLVLAVKDKNIEAIEALEKAMKGSKRIELMRLGNFYPAGDEVNLVYEVTGRIPPEGGLPLDVGAVVQNVCTLAKVADAVKGKPFTRRIVTVSGEVREPCNLDAPIGTSLKDLIRAAGGPVDKSFAVIVGGPCMGWAASSLDERVLKTTTGVLVLPPDHALIRLKTASVDQLLHRAKSVCDQCRDCTDLCPRYLLGHNLEPHRLMTAIGWGNDLDSEALRTAHLCCECGICGIYACPMGLYPNLYIQRIKEELNAAGLPRERGKTPEVPLAEYHGRKLPALRLEARLGLNDYPSHYPLREDALKPASVKIPLQQHIGVPAVPVVKASQKVQEGDLIGEIPKGALGARVHASIAGTVSEVTRDWVEIKAG
ncbi:MAG: RnfABCDGE type electron transport complex subunit C [Planctomycetota bacterium]